MIKTSHPKIDAGTIGGGIAGISSGGLLAALANNLPDSNKYKSWLVIIAPFLSVFISYAWVWIKNNLDMKNLKKRAEMGRVELLEALKNPENTEEEKNKLREYWISAENIKAKKYVENIAKIEALEAPGFSRANN